MPHQVQRAGPALVTPSALMHTPRRAMQCCLDGGEHAECVCAGWVVGGCMHTSVNKHFCRLYLTADNMLHTVQPPHPTAYPVEHITRTCNCTTLSNGKGEPCDLPRLCDETVHMMTASAAMASACHPPEPPCSSTSFWSYARAASSATAKYPRNIFLFLWPSWHRHRRDFLSQKTPLQQAASEKRQALAGQ